MPPLPRGDGGIVVSVGFADVSGLVRPLNDVAARPRRIGPLGPVLRRPADGIAANV